MAYENVYLYFSKFSHVLTHFEEHHANWNERFNVIHGHDTNSKRRQTEEGMFELPRGKVKHGIPTGYVTNIIVFIIIMDPYCDGNWSTTLYLWKIWRQ